MGYESEQRASKGKIKMTEKFFKYSASSAIRKCKLKLLCDFKLPQ